MDPLPVTSDFRAGGWTGLSRQGRRRRYNFRYHPLVLDYFKRLGDGQIHAFNNCNAWVLDALRDAGPNYLENNGVLNFMGAKDYSALLVPAREGMPVGTGFNLSEGNYNVTTGYKGDGSTMYIDSGRNNNADGQDDASRGVWISVALSSGYYLGGGGATAGADLIGSGLYRSRTNIITSVSASTSGLAAISRTESSNYNYRQDGSTVNQSRSSQTPFNGNAYIHARNDSGSANGMGDGRLAVYFIGPSITLATMDTILTGFTDRVLITSVYGDVWQGKDEATIQYLADVIRAGGGF